MELQWDRSGAIIWGCIVAKSSGASGFMIMMLSGYIAVRNYVSIASVMNDIDLGSFYTIFFTIDIVGTVPGGDAASWFSGFPNCSMPSAVGRLEGVSGPIVLSAPNKDSHIGWRGTGSWRLRLFS